MYPNLKIAICIMTSSPIWYFYSSRNRYSLVQPPLPLQARWTSIWIIMFTGGRQEEGCLTIDRTETIGRTRPNKITSFLIRYLDHESLIGKIWTVSRLSIIIVIHCSRRFRFEGFSNFSTCVLLTFWLTIRRLYDTSVCYWFWAMTNIFNFFFFKKELE